MHTCEELQSTMENDYEAAITTYENSSMTQDDYNNLCIECQKIIIAAGPCLNGRPKDPPD